MKNQWFCKIDPPHARRCATIAAMCALANARAHYGGTTSGVWRVNLTKPLIFWCVLAYLKFKNQNENNLMLVQGPQYRPLHFSVNTVQYSMSFNVGRCMCCFKKRLKSNIRTARKVYEGNGYLMKLLFLAILCDLRKSRPIIPIFSIF